DAMYVQSAARHHASGHGTGRLTGARFSICQEIYMAGILATGRAQQTCIGKIEPVVGAEQCHQLVAARCQVSGRNSPIRPWFARINTCPVFPAESPRRCLPHYELKMSRVSESKAVASTWSPMGSVVITRRSRSSLTA